MMCVYVTKLFPSPLPHPLPSVRHGTAQKWRNLFKQKNSSVIFSRLSAEGPHLTQNLLTPALLLPTQNNNYTNHHRCHHQS